MLTNWKFSETWLKQEQIEVTQKSFFGSCSQGRLQGKIVIAMVRPFWKALIVYFLPVRIFSFFASNHFHILVRHWWLHYNAFFHLVFLEIFSIKREIMKMTKFWTMSFLIDVKGTLVQIWKPANIFIFIWK